MTVGCAIALATTGLLPGTPMLMGPLAGAYALIGAGGLTLIWFYCAFGYGGLLMAGLRRATPATVVLPASLQTAIGAAVLLWLIHLWGSLGGITLTGAIGAGVLLLAGMMFAVRQHAAAVRARSRLPALHPVWLLASVSLGVMLVAAASSPGWLWQSEFGGFDALSYHLPLPIEWAAQGRITPLAHNVYSYLPGYLEAAYTHLHVLLGGLVRPATEGMTEATLAAANGAGLFALDGIGLHFTQYLSVGFAILAAWCTADVVRAAAERAMPDITTGGTGATGPRRMLRDLAAATAGATVIATPWTAVVGTLAYNETACMALIAAACAVVLRHRPEGAGANLGARSASATGLLAGMLLGAACACKPTAFFLGAPAIALLMAWAIPVRAWAGAATGAITGGVVMLAPPLLRNALAGGNPIFPAGVALFGPAHWTADQVATFKTAHTELAPLADRVGMLLGTVAGGDGQPRGMLHGQFALVWPLAIAAGVAGLFTTQRRVIASLALGVIAALVWWLFGSHCQSRFLMPLLPLLAAMIGVASFGLATPKRPVVTSAAPVIETPRGLWRAVPIAGQSGFVLSAALVLVSSLLTARLFIAQRPQPLPDGSMLAMPNLQLTRGALVMTGESERFALDEVRNSGDDSAEAGLISALAPWQWVNLLVPPDEKVYLLGDSTPLYMPGKLALGKLMYHVAWERSPLGDAIAAAPSDPEAWQRTLFAQGVRWVLLNPGELTRLTESGYYDKRVTAERVRQWLEVWGEARAGGMNAGGSVLFRLRRPPNVLPRPPALPEKGIGGQL